MRTNTVARSTAAAAVAAAEAQFTVVAGEATAAKMVRTLAREVMSLDQEMAELEALIGGRFREHPHAEVITSMPGIGDTLGAEFIAATGGDMAAFGTPDRLATADAFCGCSTCPPCGTLLVDVIVRQT